MAASTGLKKGDMVTLRWRDKNGAFDALKLAIAGIFKTNVPTVDGGQYGSRSTRLQQMMMMPGEATLIVVKNHRQILPEVKGWNFKTQELLLEDIEKIIKAKTVGGSIIWGILLMLAMLAIFDTQVLSIFRRQKEIGTYVALGMTRGQVVGLFTVEGAMHSVLAALLGAVYGIPLLPSGYHKGIAFPCYGKDYGIIDG